MCLFILCVGDYTFCTPLLTSFTTLPTLRFRPICESLYTQHNMSFVVYFIGEVPFQNRVKIGKSIDVTRRLAQLQTGCPNKLVVMHAIYLWSHNTMNNLERAIHRDLKHKRLLNEWFTLTAQEAANVYRQYVTIESITHPLHVALCNQVRGSTYSSTRDSTRDSTCLSRPSPRSSRAAVLTKSAQCQVIVVCIGVIGVMMFAIFVLVSVVVQRITN